jgi:hypothetical protein
VFFAPSFIGTNPAEVRAGPRKGERVMAEEEDLGLTFVNSLDATQRKTAIFADVALKEIVTTNKKRVDPLAPAGIAAAQLKPAQREKLMELVRLYIGRWRPELADETFAKITAAGLDKITFAWAGPRPLQADLLPHPRSDVSDRVRQFPRQRKPHPYHGARLQG